MVSPLLAHRPGPFLAAAALSAAGQDVVFRSGVDLVTVDATVIGGDGRPVTGLGAGRFRAQSGRPGAPGGLRRVRQRRFSPERDARSRPGTSPRTKTSTPAASSLVAIDQTHIRRLEGRPAMAAAARFIDTLDPIDRVAVTSLSRIGTIEFTRDRPALKRRLDAIVGQGDQVFLQFNIGLSEAVEIADGGRVRLA